jgi:hypothetical protein
MAMDGVGNLALEHAATQADVVRRCERMLGTARELLGDRVRSAEYRGASVHAIAEATGLSEEEVANLIERRR